MKRSIFFAAVAIVAVAVLWFAFKPSQNAPQARVSASDIAAGVPAVAVPAPEVRGPAQQPAATAAVETNGAASAPAPVMHEVFDLVVKNGRLVSGPAVMKVHEGERVTLHVTSDRSDELHLHGYDRHASLKPGETASVELAANRTGRFTLELHHADIELGALEVYPN